jgi:predicted AAA+ superfamily ATPase
MEKHWFRGGFPDSLLAKRDGDAQRWLDAFIKTYIERDLPLLGIGTSPQIIQRFWTMLATAHGKHLECQRFWPLAGYVGSFC